MSSAATRTLNPLVMALRERKFDVAALLSKHGVAVEELLMPNSRIEESQFRDIWNDAIALTNDSNLPISVGFNSEPHSLGVVGYVLSNAKTVLQAFILLNRYRQLVFDEPLFSVDMGAAETRINIRLDPQSCAEENRAMIEFLTATLLKLCGSLSGGQSPAASALLALEFRHQQPDDAQMKHYQDYFQANQFIFGRKQNAIVFQSQFLDLPVAYADPDMLAMLITKADAELKTLAVEQDITCRVKSIIRRRTLGQAPSISKVADDCAMSRATLQRKLSQAGTRYQKLLDETREELANEMLQDKTKSLSQIAFVLGYSDSSAFHHAYKRWAGISPMQHREQL